MIKHVFITVACATIGSATITLAQSSQKIYGFPGTNQQVLYGSFLDSANHLYTSGTFRNTTILPQNASYGTVSKLKAGTSGSLLWHKAYMPSDFQSTEEYTINSVFEDENHAIYTFGYYVSQTGNPGYYLQKIDTSGALIWSRFMSDGLPSPTAEAILGDGVIYTAMKDMIASFDLNGTIISSVQFDGLSAKALMVTSAGNLAVTGAMYYASAYPYVPLLLMDENLQFIEGHLYGGIQLETYGTTIAQAPAGELLIGVSEGIVLKVAADGTLGWANQIMEQNAPGEIFGPTNHIGIHSISQDTTKFSVMTAGLATFISNDVQNRAILYDLSLSGGFSGFRVIDDTPFASGEQLKPESFLVNAGTKTYYAVGDVWGTETSDHHNYVHVGKTDQQGCAEEQASFTISDILSTLQTIVFPPSSFHVGAVTAAPKTMIVTNLSPTVDSVYCQTTTLGIDEPNASLLQIFPNPASNLMHIEVGDYPTGAGLVTDVSGRIVLQFEATTETIDISSLSSGVYVLQLQVNNTVIAARFVKE